MLTKEQIAEAWRQANKVQAFHEANGDPDYQIADGISGVEAHFRGILAEYELSNVFGTQVDFELRRDGDGGKDAYLSFDQGRFPVDVKASTYLGPNPYLRVPCKDLKPRTIYIAARLDMASHAIELMGWEWSAVLAKCEQKSFSRGGTLNYVLEYSELRSISELKQRLQPVTSDGGFVHYCCKCGAWGAFGYGVSLLKGRLGTWYCREHRPVSP